jgi:large subunit ribosomal protein L15
MPLSRRLPKRGFRNPFRTEYQVVNLGSLERTALKDAGLIRGKKRIKILADGEFTKALTVKAHAFSGKAREKIAALGGSAEVA